MKRLAMVLIATVGMLFCGVALAKSLHPTLQLLGMKAKVTSEAHGDELYLHVVAYPSKGKPYHYQIPKYPLHWLSEHVDKISNLSIWDGELKDGDSITLVLSLVEHDVPLWNTDDLIGSIRLHLKNQRGKLSTKWSMPDEAKQPVVVETPSGDAHKLELSGEESHYTLLLVLKK